MILRGVMTAVGALFLLALLMLVFYSGFTTTRHISRPRVASPDDSIVTIYTGRDFASRDGWLAERTEKDVMDLRVDYSPETARHYDLVLINSGSSYAVPFSCSETGCGGRIDGQQPIIGRDVKLCFVPKHGRDARCARLRFAYHTTVLPTWVDIMARQ